jgi:toxin ParE1/3/4
MKVFVTEEAWSDMVGIVRSIAEDNASRAQSFLTDLYDRCLQLGDMPRAYPLLPFREQLGIRRRPFGNYLIFYRIAAERVEVLHVIHGARDYERILFPEE